MIKKKNKIINFTNSISKIERKVEAILFAASEPLDIETTEKRLKSNINVKKILEKIKPITKQEVLIWYVGTNGLLEQRLSFKYNGLTKST